MLDFDKAAVQAALDQHPFQPPRWLRNAHGQTIWSSFFRRQGVPDAVTEYWQTPDDDRLRLHLFEGREGAPWVVLLHGLEGCHESNYILGLRHRFSANGWSTAALDFRSCDGRMNRSKRLYHSGETTDFEFVVRELRRRYRVDRLYAVGFSLGGNVIAKWLGEHGDDARSLVQGAASVSPPFDLTVSGPSMDDALYGIYTRRFLRTLIPKALEKERQYPGCLDVEAIKNCKGFRDFDTHGTAAIHGFEDAEDYWRKVSCGQFLPGIRVPTLLVASADDPFNPAITLPYAAAAESPWIVSQFTERGGHVGFVHGSPWRTLHWAEEQIERFLGTLSGSLDNPSDCLGTGGIGEAQS